MTDKLLIDRELLERVIGEGSGAGLNAMRELRAILAAPRQPEGEGLEVVAWQDAENPLYTTAERRVLHDWANNGYPIVELCRLSDAQRAIAELLEERDTLRQQLAERDADAERWRYTQHPDYFFCGPYDTDGRLLWILSRYPEICER